jgi:adenylate kinase
MTAPTVFFILGGPGSGKGTNCERLVQDFGFHHISAGDLLREEAKKDTELGKKITGILAAGNIVPSEVTVELLTNAINATPNSVGYLVDGFPRKADQAVMFEEGVARAKGILYFDCSEQTMESRLLTRAASGEGTARSDDNAETIRRRFRVNVEQCVPVVQKYQEAGRCTVIDANRDKETVYNEVKRLFVGFGCKPLK